MIYIQREETKTVNLRFRPPKCDSRQPAIYIHYYKNKPQYIGETESIYNGRPFRACNGSGKIHYYVDQIRWLRASFDKQTRCYWEAYLICTLKPVHQPTKRYQRYLLNKNYERWKVKNYWRKNKKRFYNKYVGGRYGILL